MNLAQLKEDFLERFESPNEHEPYDSHEGGFYNSTLIDTEDSVTEVFTGLSEEIRKELISDLNKISSSWVRKD